MSRRVVLLVCLVVTSTLGIPFGAPFVAPSEATMMATAPSQSPEIVAVYPNPVANEDAGEFVVVSFPRPTNLSTWSLSDGGETATLPSVTISGTVAFSTAPNRTENLTEFRTFPLRNISLANAGETVTLRKRMSDDSTDESSPGNDSVVDSATYTDAPESELWRPYSSSWVPLGATDRPIARTNASTARVFVLPDSPAVPIETLQSAENRILLAGYSFASERVADELVSAANRGVTVRLVVDDAPVGGITRQQAITLDRLIDRGIQVEVIGGDRARYAFHHPKYAVADDRGIVLTENWKPSGVGGHASRGWGAVVRGEPARELAEIYHDDTSWHDTVSWSQFRKGKSFTPDPPANKSYPTQFEPKEVPVESVTVLTAPDNAEEGVISLLQSANRSIAVQQMAISEPKQPFVQATLAAARRGVEVRVLLSSTWYVEDDNGKIVDWLNERAEKEGLPLEAKLAEPRGYEKIHAKGVIVDERHVVVGSLNWNNHSARENREVALVLHGKQAGTYYTNVFDADWGETDDRFPIGLGVVTAVGLAGAVWLAKREVTFA
ncbi:Phosphatidylserine/phosphatidylglycerophosphate/cardiolipin synthase [Haladaptatus litoreus]|uniref:Phosphatidylserine/phosphatidylglycerophosphate/cardiolipin synthase n=1 Tax=Haladaptatus litoreus TaxID=553468 RepID=A0A1N6Y7H0_9EURY|nr:phospholipase D-like domain-containing protein [Haladaptatus litoreus]SIR10419.1 Phosphatidylserine/phosphatidylglycerophosphate/cardiolipin synthase [Haladaptatus litoreus]